MAIVRKVFHATNLQLIEALQRNGARATSITGGVFEAHYLDQETYGLVGGISAVNIAPIEASLRAASIPVIASLGETPSGQILNINADVAANELVHVLQPYKIIFSPARAAYLMPMEKSLTQSTYPPNTNNSSSSPGSMAA